MAVMRTDDPDIVRTLIDAAPDAMVMADEDGRIQLVNRQAEHLFGYDREELVGQPIEVLLPGRVRQAHPDHRARFWAEPRVGRMETGLLIFGRRRDGAEFAIEIRLSAAPTTRGL